MSRFSCRQVVFILGLIVVTSLPGVVFGHKLQVADPEVRAQVVKNGGRLLADYGSYQLYEVPSIDPSVLTKRGTEARGDYDIIHLNAQSLDTTKAEIKALRKPLAAFSGKRMHLIQFIGPVQPQWYDALLKTGVKVVDYIPENSYLVYGGSKDIANLQQFAAADYVQWEGPYADDYKFHPKARPFDDNGNARKLDTDAFTIQLEADDESNPATLQLIDALKLAPIKRQDHVLHFVNITVRLNPASLKKIAAQPDVVSIHAYHEPHLLCERQDQIVAGNLTGNSPAGPGYLAWLASKGFTQAQFTNFVVDVSDSGIDNGTTSPYHFGLYVNGTIGGTSRVVYARLEGTANSGSTIQGCDGHGNLNSHIIAGYNDLTSFPHVDTNGFHYGLGVCPFVKIGSSCIFDPSTFTSPAYSNLSSRAYHDGARVSNNSWGADTSGAYDSDAQAYDAVVRDAQPTGSAYATAGNQEMVFCFAAGNAGSTASSVGSPGTAKNVIVVGAGENVQAFGGSDGSGVTDAQANSANDIVSFSSRGPCSDGRIKPDICAPGTHVSGGVAQTSNPGTLGTANACFDGSGVSGGTGGSSYYPSGQQFYTASSGTSHSTPGVSGGCALVRQYFINNFGGPPSAAMTKAYLLNSARYMTGTSANDTLPSNNQGMGEMNLGTAFDGVARFMRDQVTSDLFTNSGATRVFTGTISDQSKPFRVTLAWTDAPGSTTGNAYNNNLDLTVTVGGNTYKGNVFSGRVSTTGGSADAKNNVESVCLTNSVSGVYTVTVTATSINSDGVPNNGITPDQDFALVVYNAAQSTSPLSVTPSSGFSPSGNVGGGFTPASQIYNLSNAGTTNLNWTVSKTANWLTLSETSGALAAGASTNITVSINANANSLSAGTYSDTIGFTNTTNGAGNTTRSVTLTVNSLPPAPVASFTGSPTNGAEPLTVTFTDSSTGTITNRFWDFGDSATSNTTATTVAHVYTVANTYPVTLTVFGPGGVSTNTRSGYITATAPCTAPTAYSVTGGGSYCSGGTGVAVGLAGSQTGVNYQLYNGASTVGSAVAGTGSSLSFGNQTAAGTYTVVGSNTTTACTQAMTGNATVTINTVPGTPGTITQGNPAGSSVCANASGVTYTIASVSGATSYTWSVPAGASITGGQGTTSITVTWGTTAGNVTVTANNTCGSGSAASLAVSIVSSAPTVPTASAGTSVTASGFTANWSAATGATGYDLDVATDTGFAGLVSGYNNLDVGNVTSYAVTGLSGGTPYYYRVRAYNVCGTSSNSSTQTVTTTAAVSGVLAGWDVSGLTAAANGFGPSPYAATTANGNVTVGGLTRGSGVGTNGTSASRAWGGNTWTNTSKQTAISAGRYVTCTIQPHSGYLASFSQVSVFSYRRSGTGPTNGAVQYSTNSVDFLDVTNSISYTSSSSSGGQISPIDLTGYGALQNVPAGVTVTFRIVNWGATSSGGTWYIYDYANSTNSDFEIQGTVVSSCTPPTATVRSADSTNICSGSSATIHADLTGSGPWNVTWLDGGGGTNFTQTGVAASPATRTVSPSATTTYTITSVSDASGCFGGTPSGSATVTVNTIPSTPTASNNGPICAGSTLTLSTPTVTGATYSWTGPNSFTSSLQNPSITSATTAASGTYYVTVTVSGCTSAAGSTAATVNAIPSTPTASNNGPICAGSTLSLSTPTVTGATYSWTGPNGFTSSLQNPTIPNATSSASGIYTVTVTMNGCTSAPGSTTATVNALTPFESWQAQYFGSTTNSNANPDADPYGKGISNTNQFLAGFNPNDPNAYPHILGAQVLGNDLQVTYLGANGDTSYVPGVASRTNVLEYTIGASGSYSNSFVSTGQTNILSGGNGSGIVTNMTDHGGATNTPSRFYRVRVLVP